MFALIKYAFYGVVFFMLLMAVSGFMDIFGPEVKVSDSYKEKTVIHSTMPYDMHTYNPDSPTNKLCSSQD